MDEVLAPSEFQQWKALYLVEANERARAWSQTDELLAVSIELNDMWFRALVNVLAKQPASMPKKPIEIRRPYEPKARSSARKDAYQAMKALNALEGGE